MDNSKLEAKTKEALAEIQRGCVECIGAERLESLVARFYKSGQRFIVKAGFDPTAPDLHLGHAVLLRKLAILQNHGGAVKFLIGDFTATIGDPTGKSETRKALSFEEVAQNAKTYEAQVFKILDPALTEVCFNKTWLEALGSVGLMKLSAQYSVARILERDDFSKRFKENQPISIVEFMYPLLQGYDSVALDSDLELGGSDQKFNLLVGRALQRAYNCGKEQSVLTLPLLEGLDGVNKMSKSLGNYIGITEVPNSMYAKLLSISDSLMWRYYDLLSSKSAEEIEALKAGVANQSLHPKAVKEALALELTSSLHSHDLAHSAQIEFNRIFQQKEAPKDLETLKLNRADKKWIGEILVSLGLCPSSSQARRDIKAGALKINGQKVLDEGYTFSSPGDFLIKVGKRKFAKIQVD